LGRIQLRRVLGAGVARGGLRRVWITGKSPQPAYLNIAEAGPELRDARSLWGQDTYQVQESIKNELMQPGARILGIGPAGEAGIPFALILCDHGRVAGRTGLGAVMGSKNLKAVAVHGNGKVPVADLAAYGPIRAEANRALKADPMTCVLRDLGAWRRDYFDWRAAEEVFSAVISRARPGLRASVVEHPPGHDLPWLRHRLRARCPPGRWRKAEGSGV
jgi:aldehyde:ferredoxin oxidoreductase